MKKSDLTLQTKSRGFFKKHFPRILLFHLDIAFVNLVFIAAFLLRFWGDIPERAFLPYKESFPFLTGLFLMAFLSAGCYKKRYISSWNLFECTLMGCLLGTLFAISFLYLFRGKWSSFPTSVALLTCPISIIFLFSARLLVLKGFKAVKRKVLVLGKDQLPYYLKERRHTVETRFIDSIEEIGRESDLDEIVICKAIQDFKQLNLLGYLALKLRVNFVFTPQVYADLLSQSLVAENYVRFITTFWGRKADHEEFFLRLFDIILSTLLIAVFLPFMTPIALCIKLSSKGPVLYSQKRAGKDGAIFTMYKFRTMIHKADEENDLTPTQENDPRVTKIGRFLRKTRLDELPQLINVLLGHMSIVGPRPENLPRIMKHEALRGLRLAVKPGMTGLAQIRGGYHLPPRHKRKFDCLYIQNRSFLLNMYVLAKTVPIVFSFSGI